MNATSTVPLEPRLAELISPLGGIIFGLEQVASTAGRSAETVTIARLGEVGRLTAGSCDRFGPELDGVGCDRDPATAARIAVMEALERYAVARGEERRFIVASARELGDAAVDLGDAARCSLSERTHPDFPLTTIDPDAPLRWLPARSLITGACVWVPVVMAHLMRPLSPAETTWVQTSSGCAAADSPERALLGACRELIERDALAIAWLQRLPLPRIAPCELDDEVSSSLALDEDRERIRLFDATSDLGVPVVLAVLTRGRGTPTVGAGCARSLSAAALKALGDLTICRAVVEPGGRQDERDETPRAAFAHLLGHRLGAHRGDRDRDRGHRGDRGDRHRGDWDRGHRGQRGQRARPGSARSRASGSSSEVARELAATIAVLAAESRELVAVDLTPPELMAAGIHVIRAIAPPLIPFLAHPRVRYLASRRLYEAPRRMGHRVLGERELNPWPSPLR
jgi:ribosomal protein S12 methylthiotransferase accessory factor